MEGINNMMKKEFVVFGLGRFGTSVAMALAEGGGEVLVVDKNQDKITDIADYVTHAVCADITDEESLEELGIHNFDGAVVAIGTDLEASVLVTILAKEHGIPYILAKVKSDLHAKILKKVGADMVVYPEKEMGIRIANNLMHGNFFDAIELSSKFSLIELDVPKDWCGHTLRSLNVRGTKKINVVGIIRNGKLDINPDADEVLQSEDVLVVIGKNEVLKKLMQSKN